MSAGPRFRTRVLESRGDLPYVLLVAVAVLYIAAFTGTGVLRALFPFPFDGVEPGALQEVARIRAGLPIYVAPTLDYVPQIYGPVYFYLAAAVATIARSDLAGLRLVSLLASLGSIALVTLLVRRETAGFGAALVGGALLSACSPLTIGTMDVGRPDATSLVFMLGAIFAARVASLERSATWRSAVGCGALMGVSLLAKQSSAAVAVALFVIFAAYRRDQVPAYVLALAATGGLGLLMLVAQSGRWPLYYLWELPRLHQILPELMSRFWADLVTRFSVPLLVGPFYLLARALAGDKRRVVFYTAVALSMIGMAWASDATIRGGRNVELPAYAALAILFALAVHEALSYVGSASARTSAARMYLIAAAIGQFAILLYNPRLVIPYRSDGWAGDRLSATLAALPGPIFAGSYQGFVPSSPNIVAPDLEAVVEIQGEQVRPSTPEGDQWSNDLAAALKARRFTYVIVNPDLDGFIVPQLCDAYGYVDAGPLFPSTDKYWEWRTGWVPKAEVYVRPDPDNG